MLTRDKKYSIFIPWMDPRSLEEKDKKYIWHPFTQMKEWLEEKPLIIKRGKGSYLVDINNRRYIDGVSSIWVNIHGHQKKYIDRAIKVQLRKIAHSTLLGLTNIPAIGLAEKLIKVAEKSGLGALKKVFYSDNGSTAVEVALKMAFHYWQLKGRKEKTKFLTLTDAYHGDTIGCVSLGGIDLFHKIYKPLLFKTFKAPAPYCYRCPSGERYPECNIACADKVEEILVEHHEEIVAMVIEPLVQAAAGIVVAPPGYLSRVYKLCKHYNVLFIADEVATGFGRTGRMFACEHEEVIPDLMALAKGITGGYLPLAATLVTEDIFNTFLGEYKEFKTFFHGHSYTGNPLACAAAIANIELFEKEKVLDRLQPKIDLLRQLLLPLKEHAHVGDIRQKGFMAGIELVEDKETKRPYPLEDKMGMKVCIKAREMGVMLRPIGNVIIVMPPLSISEKELKKLIRAIERSIQAVCA